MKIRNSAKDQKAANGFLSATDNISAEGAEKTFLEFFAGIGLVAEGLRPSGWKCIYANDFDERKQQMYADRNELVDYYHVEDVGKTEAILARIEHQPFLATASFPCIDLSLAGHFRGFEGKHSSAFFAFAEVLKKLEDRRPKLVMLENVVGFLSSRGGKDFTVVSQALAELDYWLDAFVLDAAQFVPQSRPRVFVIAMTKDLCPRQSTRHRIKGWPILPTTSILRPQTLTQLMRTITLPTGWVPLELPYPPTRKNRLEDFLDLDEKQEWWDETQVQRHYHMMSHKHRHQVDLFLASKTSFVGTIFRRVRRDGQRAEVRFDGLAGCLRTPRGGSGRQIVVAVQEGHLRMRWMSPLEYGRLQGVADFPLKRPRNQLLFGFADAVCVPAIRWIDQHVLTPLYTAALPRRRNGNARQPHS